MTRKWSCGISTCFDSYCLWFHVSRISLWKCFQFVLGTLAWTYPLQKQPLRNYSEVRIFNTDLLVGVGEALVETEQQQSGQHISWAACSPLFLPLESSSSENRSPWYCLGYTAGFSSPMAQHFSHSSMPLHPTILRTLLWLHFHPDFWLAVVGSTSRESCTTSLLTQKGFLTVFMALFNLCTPD